MNLDKGCLQKIPNCNEYLDRLALGQQAYQNLKVFCIIMIMVLEFKGKYSYFSVKRTVLLNSLFVKFFKDFY